MKDPSFIAAWVDSTVFQLRVQETTKLGFPTSSSLDSLIMLSGWDVIRSAKLFDFRALPSKATVLLLTPVIIPLSMTKADIAATGNSDPFEPLGRFLSLHRSRVRHVPYDPREGFTETHRIFMNQVDAIVVVTCDANDPIADTTMARQEAFVESLAEALNADRAHAARVALVWMRFEKEIGRRDVPAYDNVLRCSRYDVDTAKRGAALLFGTQQ